MPLQRSLSLPPLHLPYFGGGETHACNVLRRCSAGVIDSCFSSYFFRFSAFADGEVGDSEMWSALWNNVGKIVLQLDLCSITRWSRDLQTTCHRMAL